MCYNNCPYFRKDTETCRLPKGENCPDNEDHWPKWPPELEEYGAYRACYDKRGPCEWYDSEEDVCLQFNPKLNCPRKRKIMEQMFPEGPDYVLE